jgi:hypothetical protein
VTTALKTLSDAFGNGHKDSSADQEPDVRSPEPRSRLTVQAG